MDFEHGDGSSRKNFEVNDSDVDLNTRANDSPSSPSSSSSNSSQDYVLDINVLNDKFGKFKQEPQEPIWTPEVAGQAPQPSSSSMMAANPKGYDPKRIPAAIFASKPATPVDWSVASNESLFSIQLGNTSFSREHVHMLYKSGELSKLDESTTKLAKHNDSSKLSKPKEPTMTGIAEQPVRVQSSKLPVVAELENMDRKSEDDMEKGSEETDVSSYTQKVAIVEIGDHCQEKVLSAEDVCVSSRSDDSIYSTKSFAFPLLEGNVARNSPVKMEVHEVDKENKPSTSEPQLQPSKQFKERVQPQSREPTAKSAASNCFSCFYCFSHCR